MRKTIQFTLLVLISLALSGCSTVSLGGGQLQGSGNVTTETREVGAFAAINVTGAGKVMITQGDTDGLLVETDDNLQAMMLGEVRDGTLYLGTKPNVSLGSATRMTFTVSVKQLAAITLSGAAAISALNLNSDLLAVDHSGAGMVTVGGTVMEQDVTLSGVGSYDGAALVGERATINLSGFGGVVVNVSERLDATLSGAGNIAYIGSPELHEQVTGLGSIRQRAP